MIDLHCHILPAIDDGAADLDDALGMARQAEADAIAVVCATPHIRHDHDVRIHELSERVAALNAAIADAGIAVRIERGGEVAEPIVTSLDDDELATVALGGRWILLEPAPGPLGEPLLRAVDRLRERGFGAIVAHPERHPADDIERTLEAAVARGALVQATAATVGHGGESVAWLTHLAAHGLLHVIGSDAHSSRAGRPVALAAAYAQLEAAAADVARMRSTAEAVLRGAKLP